MNDLSVSQQKFLKALELCQSLVALQRQPSEVPCQAIELFCEVAKEPFVLLRLSEQHTAEIQKAIVGIYEYAGSVDNWKVGDCPFGVKDHCSILSFFLKIQSQKFEFFTGNWTPEKICDLLQDWKGIDLTALLTKNTPVLVSD
jgi:hypothetical protein